MTTFTDELIGICRHFGSFEREMVCCGTVTVPQCLVLQQLREGAADVGTLASRAGSSKSAMTRLVDGLERNGWVERTRDDHDRRRVVVALTAAGRAEADRLYQATDAVIDQLLAHVPAAKRDQVVESVRLLREAMDGAAEAIRGCCGPSG